MIQLPNGNQVPAPLPGDPAGMWADFAALLSLETTIVVRDRHGMDPSVAIMALERLGEAYRGKWFYDRLGPGPLRPVFVNRLPDDNAGTSGG